jgi:signal transduction histidine kinase
MEEQQRILQNTRGFFDGRNPVLVMFLGLSFIGVVTFLDNTTGQQISLSLLYLMPIGLITWNLGRRWGAFAVVVATVASVAGDVIPNVAVGQMDVMPYWNAVVRFCVFLTFAILLDTLKSIIDAQWRLVERENEVSDSLQELNDAKDTLLHAVSHDLKNPLAGILGAVQTLRRDEALRLTEEERETLCLVIQQSGHKMNRLIDDLLDLERIDRGEVLAQRAFTDLGAVAARVVRETPGLESHPVRIVADPVLASVDGSKVERLIENLIVNATRHTPPGTAIHLRIERCKDGVEVVVEDEGPGVPDDLKRSIFEPFRQGEAADGRGMGIGLSLVQRFAALHDGAVSIQDRDGGGARFVVMLPAEVTDAPVPTPSTDEASPQLQAV